MATALQALIDTLGIVGLIVAAVVAVCARAMAHATLAAHRIPVRAVSASPDSRDRRTSHR